MAKQDELVDLLLGGFQGTSAEKRKLARVLREANFSEDYGVLASALAELQAAGKPMTTAAQNYVAGKVREQFQAVYDQYRGGLAEGETPLPYEQYFARDREAYQEALGRPLNLSWARDQRGPSGRTVGEMLPGAMQADTVYGGMRWLGLSEIPQVLTQLVSSYRNQQGQIAWRSATHNLADEFQAGWAGMYASIPNYDPEASRREGKTPNFSLFAGNQARHAVRDFRRGENAYRAEGIAASALEGAFDGSGYNSPLDLAGEIQDAGHFSERSFFPADPRYQEAATQFIPGTQRQHRAQDGERYATLDVQSGRREVVEDERWLRGEDPQSLYIEGIDPDSPAGRAGMPAQAYIPSFQRALEGAFRYDLADAADAGVPLAIGATQVTEGMQVLENTHLVQPGPITGRSFEDARPPNWIDRLAAALGPEAGRAVARQLPGGGYASQTVEAHNPIPTNLWTVSEDMRSGMYLKNGRWALAPLSAAQTAEYGVPVVTDPQAIRTFAGLYDQWNERAWKGYRAAYKEASGRAQEAIDQRFGFDRRADRRDIQRDRNSAKYQALFQGELHNQLAKGGLNPRSREYRFWQTAETFMSELRDLEKTVTGPAGAIEGGERTIEQAEALFAMAERQEQGWAGVREAAVARELSGAGNYLYAMQQARDEGGIARQALWNRSPGGAKLRVSPPPRQGRPWQETPSGAPEQREAVRAHLSELNRFTRFQPGSEMDDDWIEPGAWRGTDGQEYTRSFIRRPEVGLSPEGARRQPAEWLYKEGVEIPGPGMTLAGTGHRPSKLGGWNNEADYQRLVALAEEQIMKLEPARVISGGAQGWDQALAEAALNLHVPTTLAAPFRGFYQKWPEAAQKRLAGLTRRVLAQPGGAENVQVLHGELREGESAAELLGARNDWMVENSDMLLALYNGDPGGGTASAVRSALIRGKPVRNVWGAYAGRDVETRLPLDAPTTLEDGPGEDDLLGGDPGLYAELYSEVDPPEPGRAGALSVQETNRHSSDPVIAARMAGSDDPERDDSSDLSSAAAEERAFQQALGVIADPRSGSASNAAMIADYGMSHGYFGAGWKQEFGRQNLERPENAETYQALRGLTPAREAEYQEQLGGNLSSMTRLGRKDLAMRTLLGEYPADYAAFAKNPRSAKKAHFRQALREVSEAYELGLAYQPGREAELYDQVQALAGSDPTAHAAVRSLFADPSEQLTVSGLWMDQLTSVPLSGARNRADSHANLAPIGRSHAKWSENQMDEMRGRRGPKVDPETGEISFENTPPPAGRPRRLEGLSSAQSSIAYRSFDDDQAARLAGQASTYIAEYMDRRERFDLIMPYEEGPDADGAALDALLERAGAATRASFGPGFDIGPMEPMPDPDLPAGYVRMGARVSAGGRDSSASAPESSRRRVTRLPEGSPGRDPANWPAAPQAGWKMQFTRSQQQQTAYAVEDGQGGYTWALDTKDGIQAMAENPGYGKVYDAGGSLIHQVGFSERREYDFAQKLKAQGGLGTPRAVSRAAADFPNTPQAGMTLEFKPYGRPVFYHAVQEGDGEYYWAERVDSELVRRSSPGWGTVRDADNQVTHAVAQLDYEKHAAENAQPPEPLPPAPLVSHAPQRSIAPAMGVNRAGMSAAFSRFNLALNEASAIFTAGKLQHASPRDYGLNEGDREGFRRGISNEFYGIAASSWNAMAENAPASVDEAAEILAANFGLEPDQVVGAAGAFWSAAQSAPMSQGRRRLPKELPLSRGVSRPARQIDVDMAARGAPGWRTLAGDRVAELDGSIFDSFSSPSLGETWAHPYEDARGNTHMARSMAITGKDETGSIEMLRETAAPEQLAKGESWAKTAFHSAMSGALPSTPDAIFATVKERMYQSIQKQMMDEVEHSAQQGLSRTEAGAQGNIVKELADHASKKVQDALKTALGETLGEVSSLAYEGTRTDTKVASLDDARRLYEKSRNVRDALGGRSIEEAYNSPDETIVFDDQDRSYRLGGGVSGARNLGPRLPGALGMFTNGGMGRFGSLFYGAYMLRREWQMAAAPTFQAAQKYGEGLSEYAPLLYKGQALSGTDAGFAYRQEAGEAYLGRAAYSSYGAFMDIPYRLSQSGNMSAARLLQTAGIAGGIAGGGLIGGSMLAMSGMAAAGGVLATGGLVAGGALLAGVAGMEAYNQFFKPAGQEDLTPSSIIDYLDETGDIAKANTRRVSEKYGDTYEAFAAKASQAGQTPVGRQAWARARSAELNMRDGSAPTLEEVKPWLSDAAASKYAARDEAEDLAAKVRSIRAETLEDENAIHKALQVQKRYTGSYDTNQLMQVSRTSALLGIGSDESLQQGAAYADQLGYIEGSADYTRAMMEYANLGSREERAGAQYTASRVSQLGSQVQAVMGSGAEFAGLGSRLVRAYGLTNQQQVGALASMAGGMQQYGAEFAPWQYDPMAAIVRDNSPAAASAIGSAMQGFMAGGASLGQAMNIGGMLSGLGMSAQDASVYAQMQNGDLRAYSYQAWQSGNMGSAFFDRAGRDIMQHNGGIGMGVYNNWAPKVGLSTQTTGAFLGTQNAEIISSFENGGFYGLQKLANQKSYEASMASAGIQLKGIQLQENFYWGANAGGTWDSPTAHSAWGIEDRQLALQDASQRANFADQWTRMSLSNEFSIQRENNQASRMAANNQYQNWQWSQQYNQFQQSQAWARQDWQYQDTTRSLNNAWQMEDLNEAIRFASGRERRQLVKQRDRAALSQNLEEEQVETQRDRQKQLWAQQEEQYQKQKQYMAEMQRLDQESFDINKKQREEFYKLDVAAYQRRLKEYEEEKKLSDELRELQRKFQYDQLQLSKEAAGAQAAAAAAQKEINDAIAEGQKKWEELTGTVEQMNKYNNAFRIAQATNEMMKMMDGVDTTKIDKIIAFIRTIASTSLQSTGIGGERQ